MALAWGVVAFTKSQRLDRHSDEVEPKRTCYGKVVHFIQDTQCMFLWWFCTVGSRAIVSALAFRLILQCFSHSILYGSIITIPAMGSLLAPLVMSKMFVASGVKIMVFGMLSILDFFMVNLDVGLPTRSAVTWYYCTDFILRFEGGEASFYSLPVKRDLVINWLLPALQCRHTAAIKVSKQALRERRPPWSMEIIIPQELGIITCTTISGKKIKCNTCKDFSNDFARHNYLL